MQKRNITYILSLILIIPFANLFSQSYARNGMVVCDSKIASQVGIDILKKGGNSVDASIATAFAMAVTFPPAGNIGGGGFMLIKNYNSEATSIDFREKAPISATKNMFLDAEGNLIEDLNHLSIKAIGVPGTVAGLYLAHQKYSKLSWKELIQPAIDLAENGFPFTWELYLHAKKFEENKKEYPFMYQYFLDNNNKITEPGSLWKQKALAETLKLIRDNGRDGFYKGSVAKEISTYMQKHGGLITKEDLAKYRAVERKVIKGKYKGYTVYGMGPPSSGGVAVQEMLNIMENLNFEKSPFNSANYYHYITESMRRAFADRAEHLGDPDFNENMPVDKLLTKKHANKRFESIDRNLASISDPGKFGQLYDGESTTHLSVIDKNGNAVSLTYTLEYTYGSKMGSDKLGFIFNNEMGDFNPVPGYTNDKGLIGSQANTVSPEKRMLSSMSPTIVCKDDKVKLVIGSPGGRTIINTVFQTVLNVLEFDMQVNKAIEASKIHHQWLPDVIFFEENSMSPDTQKLLKEKGHTLKARKHLGRLMGIEVLQDGTFLGASDSSSPSGAAIGY